MTTQLEALNAQFAIAGHIRFQAGENGLPKAVINNGLASAEIYLHGAHITAFRPAADPAKARDVLWMSPLAQFRSGKAIRGGVPVIWPWFGPHPTDGTKPQHGFVRTLEWSVKATGALADGSTQLHLQLVDDAATQALWPHAFELNLRVSVGATLTMELTSRNTGEQAFTAGAALHSYFAVGDISRMHIEGLAGQEYIDKLADNQCQQQHGDVRITEEVDRIYLAADVVKEVACTLHDALLARQIHITSTGSRSTVVWNPWQQKAQAMADFADDGYQHMVCIEAANAADDVRQLAPGETHSLSQTIGVLAAGD